MRQFDVFANPSSRHRRAFPFLVLLQSDLAITGHERVVAPLVPDGPETLPVRLAPRVAVEGARFRLLVSRLAAVPAGDLRSPLANLDPYRTDIVNALDFLFLGI